MPQRTHIHAKKNGSRGPGASTISQRTREEQNERDTFGEDEVPTEPTRLRAQSDELDGPVSQRSASRGEARPSSGEDDDEEEDLDEEEEEDFEEDPFEDGGAAARRAGALATSAWDRSRRKPPEDDEPDTERQGTASLPDADFDAPTLPDLAPFDKPGRR